MEDDFFIYCLKNIWSSHEQSSVPCFHYNLQNVNLQNPSRQMTS